MARGYHRLLTRFEPLLVTATWTNLHHLVVQVLGVSINQVNFLRVNVFQGLLVNAVVIHSFIIRFVYISLFPYEWRVGEIL